jgi:virginiamycin B lyase
MNNGNRIGRITPAGAITEFPIPSANPQALGIAAGPDGNLWFTELGSNKVARVTTSGTFTEWPVPIQYGYPRGIAAGPDGNLWFTLSTGQCQESIGRVTTAGAITIFPVTTSCEETDEITAGPDGAMWFTEPPYIGRISMSGVVTRFSAPGSPYGIVSGPDSHLWFTEYLGNKVGRMSTTGQVTEFPIRSTTTCPGGVPPSPGCDSSGPQNISVGPDRNLWFTEEHTDKVARMTPQGLLTEYDVPTANAQPQAFCLGGDGNLWFTEPTGMQNGQVARLSLGT